MRDLDIYRAYSENSSGKSGLLIREALNSISPVITQGRYRLSMANPESGTMMSPLPWSLTWSKFIFTGRHPFSRHSTTSCAVISNVNEDAEELVGYRGRMSDFQYQIEAAFYGLVDRGKRWSSWKTLFENKLRFLLLTNTGICGELWYPGQSGCNQRFYFTSRLVRPMDYPLCSIVLACTRHGEVSMYTSSRPLTPRS